MADEAKKLIEEQKKSLFDLFTHQKIRFIVVITRIVLAILFMIGLFLPALVGDDIIAGGVSLSVQFAATGFGFVFWLVFILSIFGYFLMILMKKEQIAKIILLVQAFACSVVVLWGTYAVYFIQLQGFAAGYGFGFFYSLVFLVVLWLAYAFEEVLFNLVRKAFGKSVTDETDYSTLFVKQPSDLYTEKNIILCVIQTVFTFGVYGLIWLYSIAKKIQLLNEESKEVLGEFLLILFVPFYIFFWMNKAGLRLSEGARKQQIELPNNGTLYWVLTLFGLVVVTYAMIQNDLNKIAKVLKEKQAIVTEVIEKPIEPEEPTEEKSE